MSDAFLLPGAAALSEFQGYTGDCGEDALLAALHVLKGAALDAAELDMLVRADIAAHRASADGAEPLSSVAANLSADGIEYDLFPYAEPFPVDWHQVLLDVFHGTGGRKPGPVIFEFAHAGELPGDESGVRYHFATALGISAAGYYTADGDNPAAARGELVIYSYAQLAAAVPCGLIVCHMPAKAPATPQAAPDLQAELATLKAQLTTLQVQLTRLTQNLTTGFKALLEGVG